MSEITYKGMTAAQYRAAAQKSRERVSESWQRSDTDGFMSQWAGDLTAQMYELQAKILDEGGTAEFPALFDLDGNLIAAKLVSTYDKYTHSHVSKWAILASDNPDSEVLEWIKLSNAQDEERRIANNAKKGYYEGIVIAPAAADMIGANKTSVSVTVKRTDGGFSRDAQIIDSGKLPEVRKLRARALADQFMKDHPQLERAMRKIDDDAAAQLSKSKNGRKLVRDAQKSSKTTKSATRTKSATKQDSAPAASSRAASTSHADCAHEATKSARARCRRERAAKKS